MAQFAEAERGSGGFMQSVPQVSRWAVLFVAVVLLVSGCEPKPAGTPATRLRVESRPEEGASIWIDGGLHGETPRTIEGIRPGPALVELVKDGYKRTWKAVEIVEGEEITVVLDLEPVAGYLTVRTVPAGAEVVLDGTTVLGTTPLIQGKVPVGEHRFEVVHSDYRTIERALNIEENFRYTFTFELDPKPAVLRVFSRPTGAQVWLNFVPQDRVTPAEFHLEPGDYTVAIYAAGYLTAETTIRLGTNATEVLQVILEEGDAPLGMVLVPAGEFIFGVDRGSPDERPQQVVHLDAFYIDKYEVTNSEFAKVFPDHKFSKGQEYYPVTGVTWHQATAYAAAVDKRLPTEMEWEKAARGTDGRQYPWGNEFDASRCNSGAVPGAILREVGETRAGASPYGCHDMAGNACEWTASWYQAYRGNTDIRQQYGQIYRVLRGGSYRTGAFDVRCPRRWYDHMDSARQDYGFRCAKDVVGGSRDARAR